MPVLDVHIMGTFLEVFSVVAENATTGGYSAARISACKHGILTSWKRNCCKKRNSYAYLGESSVQKMHNAF